MVNSFSSRGALLITDSLIFPSNSGLTVSVCVATSSAGFSVDSPVSVVDESVVDDSPVEPVVADESVVDDSVVSVLDAVEVTESLPETSELLVVVGWFSVAKTA